MNLVYDHDERITLMSEVKGPMDEEDAVRPPESESEVEASPQTMGAPPPLASDSGTKASWVDQATADSLHQFQEEVKLNTNRVTSE